MGYERQPPALAEVGKQNEENKWYRGYPKILKDDTSEKSFLKPSLSESD